MGFLVFTILLLPAILLYAAVQALISPFAGVLAPVLALLNDPVFVYWMLRVLLVWNILVSAALVLVRRSMKRTRGPNWKWEYIHAVLGWRRLVRRLVCLVLSRGLRWEILLVLIYTVLIAFSSFFFRF